MPPAEGVAVEGDPTASRVDRPPRLASETWRSMAAVALAAPVMVWRGFVRPGRGRYVADVLVDLGAYWTVFTLVYIFVTWWVYRRVTGDRLNRWLAQSYRADSRGIGRWLGGASSSSWAMALYSGLAMLMMIVPLVIDRDLRSNRAVQVALIANMVCSWAMVVVTYAVEYARRQALEGGLEFPGTGERRLGDYVYLAAQIQTTFSSSDVEVCTTRMRNRVTFQSLTAFAFNTIIIAAIVSILLSSLD